MQVSGVRWLFRFQTAVQAFVTQLIGVVSIGAFVFIASLVVWFIIKATIGIRVSAEEEMDGLDRAELGMEAYPEFGTGTQRL